MIKSFLLLFFKKEVLTWLALVSTMVHVDTIPNVPSGRAAGCDLPPKAQPAPGNAQAPKTATGSGVSGKPRESAAPTE
jgi:hypothetical protein